MGSLLYNDIIRQVGLRIDAITGALPPALESNYATVPVTTFQSSIFPQTAIYDAVRLAEEKMAQAISETGNETLRTPLLSVTDTLGNGDSMPSTDTNDVNIIGQYGSVLDADDPTIACTAASIQEIRRYWRTQTYWKLSFYLFNMDGNGIFHTRPDGVIVQCCVYDGATQQIAITNNSAILLADSLEEGYVNGALAELMRDDEFVQQAGIYRGYFEATLQSIRAGYTSVPSVATPGPVLATSGQ